ncbi:unnamed protein product [Adineta steineri]|nr:unnamed protein product [Adineta steineri]CAF0789427.1 unnamed protein product [Adineta steineri]
MINRAKPSTTEMAITEVSAIIATTITKVNIHSGWDQNGITVAGGNGKGNRLDQLDTPRGLDIDADGSVYVTDLGNKRIVRWRPNATNGEIFTCGDETHNFHTPYYVVIDKKSNSIIICYYATRVLVRCSLRNPTNYQIIARDIGCFGVTIDHDGAVYVSDLNNFAVKRWREGESNGTIVAGGYGKGKDLDQLDGPTYLFVDKDYSVYVSDTNNHRVMKWAKDAKEGILVAGNVDPTDDPRLKLSQPYGLFVDCLSNVHVVDYNHHQVMLWSNGLQEVRVVIGGYEVGDKPYQLNLPHGLAVDRQGNFYVVDYMNNRVQKFDVDD